MGHRDDQPELIGEALQGRLPSESPIAIGPATIRLDEQAASRGVGRSAHGELPAADGGDGESGGLVRRADDHETGVATHVVDPIGDAST